jgi:hypothetical protein
MTGSFGGVRTLEKRAMRGTKGEARRASLGRPPAQRFGCNLRIAYISFGLGQHKPLSPADGSPHRGPALRGFAPSPNVPNPLKPTLEHPPSGAKH